MIRRAPSRVDVIGASGTGKTTLARAIVGALGIPAFESDDYYHVPTDPPYRVQRTPEERCAMLERDLALHASWVLSGGAATWSPAPALDFTLRVFLYLPPEERLRRLIHRERESFGDRIARGGDMEADHLAFLAWTRGYDDSTSEGTNTLAHHEALVARATCPVLRLSGAVTREEALSRVLAQL
ncbi:MAG: hypothetical protein QOH91_4737 [Mycobacterium sp.]|nr:hypothetical protein [Mycobacterium sp.]